MLYVTPGFIGRFQFEDDGAVIENPAATFLYTMQAAAIAANRILNLPLIAADDTIAVLGLAQTFSATQDFAQIRPSASNTFSNGTSGRFWTFIYALGGLQIAANNYAFQVSPSTTSGLYFNNAAPKSFSFHISAVEKHSFYNGSPTSEGAFYHVPRTSDALTTLNPGSLFVFDNGASDLWLKVLSNSIWVDSEQKETIAVTPSATITLTHHAFTNVYAKWTAGENETVNASGTQVAGQRMTLIIVNDATLARTITFGTGFKPSATIVGTVSKAATIDFISDGTNWWETNRTLLL